MVDAAILLPAQAEADIVRLLEVIEQQTGAQVVVATLPSLQSTTIEDYGYQLGRAWASASRAGTMARC